MSIKRYLYTGMFSLLAILMLNPEISTANTVESSKKVLELEHQLSFEYKLFSNINISPSGNFAVLRAYKEPPRKDYLFILDVNAGKFKCKIPGWFHGLFDGVLWAKDDRNVKLFSSTRAYEISIESCKQTHNFLRMFIMM